MTLRVDLWRACCWYQPLWDACTCGSIISAISFADEMGMGKTIQAISLIMTHRTDDTSKLPPIISAAAAAGNVGVSARAVVRKVLDPSRPKLRLGGAPQRQEEQGGSSAAQAEAAFVPSVEAAQPQDAHPDGSFPAHPSALYQVPCCVSQVYAILPLV